MTIAFKTLALGVYPDVSLANARVKQDGARKDVTANVDPSEARKAEEQVKAGATLNNLEAVAKKWAVSYFVN